jgi:hypothetical protein
MVRAPAFATICPSIHTLFEMLFAPRNIQYGKELPFTAL